MFKAALRIVTLACVLVFAQWVGASTNDRGIYLTAYTAMLTKQMNYLITQAKATGINTFVIDVEFPNKIYAQNVQKVKQAGIRYVARLVVFPSGGTADEVKSKAYWEKRWKQAQYAVSLGADAIQLDYIRYKPSQRKSDQNAKDIYQVIKFFHDKLAGTKTQLQIDVFGIAAHTHSKYIGQDVELFANTVNTICPMVYPSHYEPFRYHSERPYETITGSLLALRSRTQSLNPNLKINAFIEMYNIRYPMSTAKRIDYIRTEIKAAQDAGANGWYAWSANNKYQLLFQVLKGGLPTVNLIKQTPDNANTSTNASSTSHSAKSIKS